MSAKREQLDHLTAPGDVANAGEDARPSKTVPVLTLTRITGGVKSQKATPFQICSGEFNHEH
jgi:hypothetical protein